MLCSLGNHYQTTGNFQLASYSLSLSVNKTEQGDKAQECPQ
jgi:hypothetical protein